MADIIYTGYYNSPIGTIKILSTENAITNIDFFDGNICYNEDREDFHIIRDCIAQLSEYFNKKRVDFDLPLLILGTPFQKSVYDALRQIPYGKTKSYMDIAKEVGNEKASRAVGMANNKNRLAIVIPCHRVIGKDGNLVGYAGGLYRKKWLLNHEGGNYELR